MPEPLELHERPAAGQQPPKEREYGDVEAYCNFSHFASSFWISFHTRTHNKIVSMIPIRMHSALYLEFSERSVMEVHQGATV